MGECGGIGINIKRKIYIFEKIKYIFFETNKIWEIPELEKEKQNSSAIPS